MKISPIAPALYIAAMASLVLTLLDATFNLNIGNPIVGLVLYFFLIEASKFIATYTLEEDDGTDHNS